MSRRSSRLWDEEWDDHAFVLFKRFLVSTLLRLSSRGREVVFVPEKEEGKRLSEGRGIQADSTSLSVCTEMHWS